MVFVADGNLAGDDVGQRIDKHRRRRVELLGIGDCPLERAVGIQRGMAVEKDQGTVGTGHEPYGTFGLQQNLRRDEPNLAQHIHLEELRVIHLVLAVQVRQKRFTRNGLRHALPVQHQAHRRQFNPMCYLRFHLSFRTLIYYIL